MASYLATATIGEFDLNAYEPTGSRYWDAIDPDLFGRRSRRTPASRCLSRRRRTLVQAPHPHDHRAVRRRDPDVLGRPGHRAGLGLLLRRGPHAGADDWTTLPEATGNTSTDTGDSCPFWLRPSTRSSPTTRPPTGPSACLAGRRDGEWNAATGSEPEWTSGRSTSALRRAGAVEVSLSYASDDTVQGAGVAIDDIVVSTGEGNTSFEDDGDVLDGWTVPGHPTGSPGNENDWTVGTQADLPPSPGDDRRRARSPGSRRSSTSCPAYFGRYPFSAAGGIVDDLQGLGFALENQTRPIYATSSSPTDHRRRASSCTSWPTSGTATTSPRAVAGHLAQRGLRHVRRVAVERARGPRRRRRRSSTSTWR